MVRQAVRLRLKAPFAVLAALAVIVAFLPTLGMGTAAAATSDPIVTLESGTNGCNGVLPTPGSANTLKELDPSASNDFNPGGHVGYVIDYPVDASDVAGRTTFVITDCVFVDGTAAYKYTISFVPNTVNYKLRYDIPVGISLPLGGQFCNYAKTTAAPSTSQASNRKAGPSCFTIGGALRIEKRVDSATGALLTGTNSTDSAHFTVVCYPTETVPPTIITDLSGATTTNPDGSVSASGYTMSGTIAINGPSGTKCDVTETSAPTGYIVDSTVRHLQIPVGTARTVSTFINATTGTVSINKTTDVDGTFHFAVDCGSAYTNTDIPILTVKGAGSWKSPLLPTGTQCTVTENANALFTTVSTPSNGVVSIARGDVAHVDFTNTRKTGKFTINKSTDEDGIFDFSVSCDNGYKDDTASITTAFGSGTWTSPALPTGTKCTATETANALFNSVVVGSDTATIGDNGGSVAFSNTRKAAKLTINKATDEDGTFNFHVDCGTAFTGDVTVTTVKGVGQWNSAVLPTGTACTVTEDTPSAFTSSSDPADGSVTITGDGAHVDFQNVRKTGTLTIDKTTDIDGTFTFNVDCGAAYNDPSVSIKTSGGTGSWTSPSIPTGTQCTVTENDNPLYVSTVGASGDSAVITAAGSTVTYNNVKRTGALTLTKAVDKTQAAYGDLLTYTLEVAATGNLTQTNVVVEDPLPANTTYVDCVNPCTATYDAAGNRVIWNVGTLVGGDTASMEFHVRIVAATPASDGSYSGTTIVNSGSVSSDQQVQPVSSNEVQTTVPGYTPPPPPPPSNPGIVVLSLAKTAIPVSGSVVQPGQTINYTVTVKNSGNADAPGVTVVDTLPAHLTVNSSTISDKGVLDTTAHTITWALGTVAADTTKAVTFAATVDQDTPKGTDLVNVATLGNQQSSTTHRVATGNLTLVKTVNPTSGAQYGSTLTYGLNAVATGTLNQTGVTVTDVVPTGTTYVAGSAKCLEPATSSECTTSYDAATKTVTWTLGSMGAGAARGLQFQVTIDTPAAAADGSIPATTITNVGNIKSDRTDVLPSNEVKTDVIAVLGEKTVKPPVVTPPAVEPQKLPFTGAPTSLQLGAGGLLLMLGAGLLMASRRRKA